MTTEPASHPFQRNRTFAPSELLIFAEHAPNIDAETIVEGIRREITMVNEQSSRLRGYRSSKSRFGAFYPERVVTFNSGRDRGLSMLRVSLERTEGESRFADIYSEKYRRFASTFVSDEVVINYTTALNRSIRRRDGALRPREESNSAMMKRRDFRERFTAPPRDPNLPVVVRSVMPNWYNTATQGERIGTGGPGGQPVPAPLTVDEIQKRGITTLQNMLKFAAHNQPVKTQRYSERDDEVEIAILDTVPSLAQLNDAYTRLQDHPLMKALFGETAFSVPNNTLNISYDESDHWSGLPLMEFLKQEVVIEDHHYDMSDHGTFIASVIYQTMNTARERNAQNMRVKFHLVQVLSDKGVGTADSILRGIQRATENRQLPGAPLLINCSFTMLTPREAFPKLHLDGRARPTRLQGFDKALQETSRYGIETLLDDLWDHENVTIVAAAGNEGKKLNDATGTLERSPARFPAALPSVIGVASLKSPVSDTLAPYSNFPDNPVGEGFAVFGGEIDGDGMTMAENAIYGLYTAETFPPSSQAAFGQPALPNLTGWGAWAGTSFATPIVTGALALARATLPEATPDEMTEALHTASLGVTTEGGSVLHLN